MSTLEFNQQLVGLRSQLYYFALGLTKNRDDALDLVQESILRALSYRNLFRENTNFKAWIYTIVRNTFINGHRRLTRKRAIMHVGDHDTPRNTWYSEPGTSENLVVRGELERSLARLSEEFRTPFLMHHEGFKYHEIAEHMRIPVGTVKSRIHQARQRLQAMLAEQKTAAA